MENKKRLIDAEPIKKFIVDGLNNPDLKKAFGYDAIEILAEIEYAPTVDAVEVVHGRWLIHKGHFHDFAECSLCGEDYDKDTAMAMNYCPNCGAKMDGDGNG